ncbi:MAG TPA: carboxypeptidase regulatory-like domain-containing protein [Gemmatimonadales bacterium]|nr:carboxypeptidase regulatory-like domain-containing protein [Gemmatimonadales bacterium]
MTLGRSADVLVAALVAIAPCSGLAAQAGIRGRVIDSEFGHPLAGAVVRLRPGTASVTSDTLGRFEAQGLAPGEVEIRIQLLGYAIGIFKVYLTSTGTLERDFALDFTGHRLPAQVVEARAQQLAARYADFEQRRQRGLGAYLRWDDLKEREGGTVGDALRTIRGVRIQCNQETYECFVVMTRTPRCQPTWWVDGVEVRSFHENTPIRDIYGIEVYRGTGEIPAEFAGSNAACGVIVVWTKSRPYQ